MQIICKFEGKTRDRKKTKRDGDADMKITIRLKFKMEILPLCGLMEVGAVIG